MELFKLLGTIAVDNTKANSALNETSDKAKESANETEGAFSKIGGAAKKIATGIGAAGMAIGGAFIGAVEGTREYRVEMAKLDTAFVTNGHSSEVAKKTYSDLNAVLGDSGQAVEASNHLALLTDNEKDLGTWTDICTGVYATFGDSLPIEGLTEAANETAKTGALTGGLVDALNWAGIGEEKFQEKLDSCSNEQERQKLIMDTLNGAYKDASKQYQETNKDVIEAEKAQERLKDALAEVGKVGEPIMTAIKNAIASMAEKAVPVIADLIKKFQDFSKWIKDNEEKVKMWSGLILIATATAAGFVLVLTWSTIMKKAASALKVVTVAVKALNVAMKANVIGLVVTAIIGLVAAFIYLWNNCESFRKFWINLWKVVSKAASDAWKSIKKAWTGIGKWFSDKFDEVQKSGKKAMKDVKKWFSDTWKDIKKVWSAAAGFFKGIVSGIKQAFSSVKSWFVNLFKGAWNGVKKAWNGAKSFFSGIWSGIKRVFGSVGSWFGSTFSKAWNRIKSAFSGWGSFFGGLWTKIKSKFGSIGSSIGQAMGNAVKSGMNTVISKVESTINKGIGLINSAIGLANKLPGINVGKVKNLSLPRLYEGTVTEAGKPYLLEGTGAEAVVPLHNNRKWLSAVAKDLNELQGNQGNYDDIMSRMNRIIELLETLLGMNIYLDSGVLVGELTPAIDARLGRIYSKTNRGNTR